MKNAFESLNWRDWATIVGSDLMNFGMRILLLPIIRAFLERRLLNRYQDNFLYLVWELPLMANLSQVASEMWYSILRRIFNQRWAALRYRSGWHRGFPTFGRLPRMHCVRWHIFQSHDFNLNQISFLYSYKFMASGEYLDPWGMRMGSAEGSTMRNFIVFTIHLIYSGWINLEDWDGRACSQNGGR